MLMKVQKWTRLEKEDANAAFLQLVQRPDASQQRRILCRSSARACRTIQLLEFLPHMASDHRPARVIRQGLVTKARKARVRAALCSMRISAH